MHGRLVILQHSSPAQLDAWQARLGPGWQAQGAPGLRLLSRGAPWRETLDGRAVGARTGVLYELDKHREALVARGVPSERLDGDGVCVETIGSFGPRGLAQLPRHGLVALYHRSQGGVLIASDAQGIAPLYRLTPPEGGLVVGGDRAALRRLSGLPLRRFDDDLSATIGPATGAPALWRVPPGVALLVSGRGAQAMPWHASGGAAPYFRERPADLRHAAAGDDAGHDAAQHFKRAVRSALRESAHGWQRDRGPLAVAAGEAQATMWDQLGWRALQAELSGAPWPTAGAAAHLSLDEVMAAYDTAFADSPFSRTSLVSPEARLPAGRRLRRWLRLTWWRCGPLEAALDAAAAADRAVALPHLAPRVVATTGALPAEARPWTSAAGLLDAPTLMAEALGADQLS